MSAVPRRVGGRIADDFAELETLHRRAAPRYDREYGGCPVCHLGATAILPLSGVFWAACEPCRAGWCIGIDLLDLPMDRALTMALAELTVHIMAGCALVVAELPTLPSRRQETTL